MTSPYASWNWERLGEAAAGSPAPDAGPPRRIGKYLIAGELGRGAMGIVYEAEDTQLGRPVAVKILHESTASSRIGRERFEREARAAAALSHPNLVQVFDAGEEGGRVFLVMERVDGSPMTEVLGARRTETRALLGLLEKVARGAAVAHAAGIVHRDIKPANILVSAAGEPKLGDFGLACWVDGDSSLTKTGAQVGTPMYMAPEQVRGDTRAVGPWTDVYALGGILYEVLTGRPPHSGDSTMDIYSRILSADPLPPRRLNLRVSGDLETVCLKALEKEPGRRYPSALQFADDLRRGLDGEPILARPPSLATRMARGLRRHRALSSALAAAIVVLAGGLVVAGIRGSRERADRDRRIAGLLDEGRQAIVECRRLRAEAAQRRDEARDPRRRAETWDLESVAARLDGESHGRRQAAVDAYTRILGVEPSQADATRELAALYYEDYEEAEEAGDRGRMDLARRLVDLYGGEAYRARLLAEGTLGVETDPPGASVGLSKYEETVEGRLVAQPLRDLGVSPLDAVRLPAGSYLLLLRVEGRPEVRHPLLVRRGRSQVERVTLFSAAEIGEGFVHVPAGSFLHKEEGARVGQPEVRGLERLPDFFIGRHEVTLGEYFEFVNHVLAAEGRDAAQKRVPRAPGTAGYMVTIPPGARHIPIERGFEPRSPVSGISWRDAEAYCRWRTLGSGGQTVYGLPTALQWEKAARGADGREFPWGHRFHPSFTACMESTGGPAPAPPVGSFPADESPYGVRDLSGSVWELLDDWKDPDAERPYKVVAGGSCVGVEDRSFGISSRQFQGPEAFETWTGFRLVRSVVR